MFAICICNKDLSESIARNQLNNFFDALGIKFIKNIIEQKQWRKIMYTFQKIKLRQFERNEVGFVLPLRSYPFHWIFVEQHFQFVLVNSLSGVTEYSVSFPCGNHRNFHIAGIVLRLISQTYLFGSSRNSVINFLKNWNKLNNKAFALLIDICTRAKHLLFPYFIKSIVDRKFRLKQSISLLQCIIILH